MICNEMKRNEMKWSGVRDDKRSQLVEIEIGGREKSGVIRLNYLNSNKIKKIDVYEGGRRININR